MAYDARQIANWFVARFKRDGGGVSVMSLLKLTYIAHGWHLEMSKGPLFQNRIQAWKYGPVIPDVYNSFSSQGLNVQNLVPFASDEITDEDASFLEQIYNVYSKMSAFRLSDLTHESGGPWDIATKLGGSYADIPNELIKSHYEMKRLKSKQAANG